MKICTKCDEVKPLDEFHKDKRAKDGYRGDCKVCKNAQTRQWVIDHRERKAATDKQWKQSHPERVKATDKRWRLENLEAVAVSSAEYRVANPLKIKAHYAVKNAITAGKLTRPDNCSECNATGTIQAHHDDYTKPLEVMWLCQTCHIAWHKEHGTDLNGETVPHFLEAV